MIPAAFEYHRPKDLSGVISILEEHGDDARVMAGGHSLIPMMKLRMADIPHLIDLQDVGGLTGIEVGETITIGAMTTQAEIIDHAGLADAAPILREATLKRVRNVHHSALFARNQVLRTFQVIRDSGL